MAYNTAALFRDRKQCDCVKRCYIDVVIEWVNDSVHVRVCAGSSVSSVSLFTHGRWSKSSTLPLGRTVTLLTSLCNPSRRKRRNSWASCWLQEEQERDDFYYNYYNYWPLVGLQPSTFVLLVSSLQILHLEHFHFDKTNVLFNSNLEKEVVKSNFFYFRNQYQYFCVRSRGCDSLPLPTGKTSHTLTCIPQIGGRISGSGFWIRTGSQLRCWTTSTWSVSAWQTLTEDDKLQLDTGRNQDIIVGWTSILTLCRCNRRIFKGKVSESVSRMSRM